MIGHVKTVLKRVHVLLLSLLVVSFTIMSICNIGVRSGVQNGTVGHPFTGNIVVDDFERSWVRFKLVAKTKE